MLERRNVLRHIEDKGVSESALHHNVKILQISTRKVLIRAVWSLNLLRPA